MTSCYTLKINTKNYIEDEDGTDGTNATGVYNSTSYTDHDDSLVNGALKFGIPVTYTGTHSLTYNIQSSVTVNGHTFSVINNNDGTFSLNKAQFQYLNAGEAIKLCISITVSDGSRSACGTTYVTIVGTNDNHVPCVQNVCYTDDEDGLNTVAPNDTLTNAKLVFGFSGSDSDGDALTYSIKTGAFTSGGQSYTVASTATAGTYTVTNNGQTFTVKDLGNGRFEYLTSEFQYLNAGQTRTLVFQYTANDGHGNTSGVATATVTIVGTDDNHVPCVQNVCYQDDEDGLNTVNPSDTLVNTKLVFGFNGSDSDAGDVVTYHIKTGTFTSGGQSYTVASTATAGTYTVTNNGQTFTVKDLGNGKFEYLTSEFQYLNAGQTRTLVLQYNATDSHGGTSGTATATVTIYGTSDNHAPTVDWVHYYDDEDGDETFAPNDTVVANHLVFNFVGHDVDGDTLTYHIQTGTYTHPSAVGNITVTATGVAGQYTITTGGHTYHVTDLGNGQFEYQTSEFQYLNPGESVFLPLKYTATDGHGGTSGVNWAKVTIYGRDDNHSPCTVNVCYSDDEDGLNTVNPSDTEVNTKLVFSMHGTDSDGDVLTYAIKTGTFTSGGQSYTVAATATAGTYTVTNAGQTFTVKDLGAGKFEYLTSEFQYLNAGQTRTLVFQYTANDGHGGTSNVSTATVTIYGTDDNSLVASNQNFIDDEDAIDATGATAVVSGSTVTDHDDGLPGTLKFTISNFTHVGSGAVTFSGIPASIVGSDGVTYNITNNGNGAFTVNKADFQHLAVGQAVTLTFNYTVSADGLTSTAVAKVVIIGTNDGPDAVDDHAGTIADGASVTIPVLANDTDPDGDDLDVSSINSLTINGVVIPAGQWAQYFAVNNETGQLVFNSSNMNVPAGTSQDVVINYTATDNNGGTDSANVFVTVCGPNVSLVASNQQFVDDEDAIDGTAATAGGYTDHDDGLPGSLKFAINNFTYNGSGTVTVTGVPATLVGSDGNTYNVTNNGNGTFTLDQTQFQHLAVGEKVEFTFSYTASDGSVSSTAQAHVIIIGTNDGIDAVDDNVGTIADGASVTVPVLANDTDIDGEDLDVSSINSLVINGVTIPAGQWAQYFTVNNETGQLVFNSADMNVAPGTSQNVVINYTATDPHGATDSANVLITVQGEQLSLVASNQQFVDDEDAIDGTAATAGGFTDQDSGLPGTLQFTINNFTYNGSDAVTFSGVPATVVGSDGVTYNVTNNGNGTFTVNKADFQHLAVGQFVTLTFNYTVTAGALTSTAQAKAIIIGTNDGPDAVDDHAGTIADGASVTIPVLANDTDPDGDDLDVSSINSLTINGVVIPAGQWSQYFTVNNETGQLVFNSADMNVAPGTSQDVVINYTATDNHGGTDSANVYVTVQGEALSLVASNQQFVDDEDAIDGTGATAGAYTDQDSGIPGALQFTINNFTYNGSDAVTFSGVPATVVGSDGVTYNVTNNGNGTFSVNASAFQHLAVGQLVTLTFMYTVTAGALTSTAEAKAVIIGTNDAPVAVDDNVGTITEGTAVTVPVLSNDSDPDGDAIHVTHVTQINIDGTIITNPAQIADYVTVMPDGQLYVNTASIDLNHDYNIVVTYEIADPYGLTDTANVLINIHNPSITNYYGDNLIATYQIITTPANASDAVVITSSTMSGLNEVFTNNTQALDDANAYGDLGNMLVKAVAGDATAYASPAALGGSEFALAITDATISNNTFTFGNDTITLNRGLAVGDVGNLTVYGEQGDASANFDPNCFNPFAKATANVAIKNNTFNFGDDNLTVGKANVFGDVQQLGFTYVNGTATGNGTLNDNDNWNFGNHFNFGDDTITAKEGTLTGDLSSVVVNGATYNLSNASDLAAFQATTAYTANTFVFGHDTFVFDAAHPGDISITDFNIGGVHDTLKIVGMHDVNGGGIDYTDLTAVSQVINDGAGHAQLVIDVNGDGSVLSTVTLLNATFNAAHTEITDYLSTSDLIVTA